MKDKTECENYWDGVGNEVYVALLKVYTEEDAIPFVNAFNEAYPDSNCWTVEYFLWVSEWIRGFQKHLSETPNSK
jgi:hypothetical protein